MCKIIHHFCVYIDAIGSRELIVNRKTYRIGDSYSTLKNGFIYQILNIFPGKQEAECKVFIPFHLSFLGNNLSLRRKKRNTFYELSRKEIHPLTMLHRRHTDKFQVDEWMVHYDPRKVDLKKRVFKSFAYVKKGGTIGPLIPNQSKPKVLELFAGAGGMCLGFRNAGMETRWAVEKDNDAVATLRTNNCKDTNLTVYPMCVRKFLDKAKSEDAAYPSKGEVDHIHASAPCQGYSGANRVGGEDAEANNELSYTFIEAIEYFDPQTGTFENVRGLLFEKNIHYLHQMISKLLELGYQARIEVLNSSDYGDPQDRVRVFLFVAKTHRCLPAAPAATHGDQDSGLLMKRTIAETIGYYAKEGIQSSTAVNVNGIIDFNCNGPVDKELASDEYIMPAHCKARTILCKSAAHYEGRYTTVRENACLMSFPCNYNFHGSPTKQFKQVGNAVPVMMATQVARTVARTYGLP